MITTWVITIITFLIGYRLGAISNDPEKLEELELKKNKLVRKITRKEIGAVTPMTPRERDLQGTRREATEKAMEELLDEVL